MGRSGDWAVESFDWWIPVKRTAADLDGIRPEEEDRPGGWTVSLAAQVKRAVNGVK